MTDQNRPVLFVVDNDQQALEKLAYDLEEHTSGQYQVETSASAQQAMEALIRLRLKDTQVALMIVDCDLGSGDGTDVIEKGKALFPDAKRVLMAGYAEKEDVADAIQRLSLDDYLLKPVQHPEDDLYPVVDDLLKDWQASMGQGNGTDGQENSSDIRIIGYRWSARSHEVKDFLARNLVPYHWMEIEQSEARRVIQAAGLDSRHLPVVFFPDGEKLVQPAIEELAGKVGLQQRADSIFYDLVVVGGGPAGLSAAVYGASEGLRTLMIEKQAPGGQAGTSSRIENYLGFPAGLSGSELTRRAVAQAARFGVEILNPQEATSLRVQGNYRLIRLANDTEVICQAVLIATGVAYRRLEVPGEQDLTGAGVYYGAVITEAISCMGKEVFVLGGGNSAGQASIYLSRFAQQITILTLGSSLAETMSQYLVDQIESTENIRVRANTTVTALHGGEHLESITLRNQETSAEETVPTVALFVYIGAHPRTDWLGDLLARSEDGYIMTGPDVVEAGEARHFRRLHRGPFFLESSIPGIFAAGDTRYGSVKRIASSVGEGAMAVTLVHQYLASL